MIVQSLVVAMFMVSSLVCNVDEKSLEIISSTVLSDISANVEQMQPRLNSIIFSATDVLKADLVVANIYQKINAKLTGLSFIDKKKAEHGYSDVVIDELKALAKAKKIKSRAAEYFKLEYEQIVSKEIYKKLPQEIRDGFENWCDEITNVSGWKRTRQLLKNHYSKVLSFITGVLITEHKETLLNKVKNFPILRSFC